MPVRLAAVFALTVAAVASAGPADGPFQTPPAWKARFAGVEVTELAATAPRPMKGLAVRIDLTAPGIEFLATPDNGDREGETDGLKTSTFLKEHKLQLAINAAPFAPIHKDERLKQDVVGLHVSRGKVVSGEQGKLPALLLTKDNKARVASPRFDLAGVWNAVGGFHVVLKGGQVIEGDKSIHPRTAAGVSADGRTLVWLVIDGRQKNYSDGATTADVGAWLKALGCEEGINLDGGGTTTLVVEGLDGMPRVLNRPIHANKAGAERVSASHLGLYARPLTAK
ncbi:phosphodiester glycosidase family protein [bacterium]|nr:phosphodiester glycosidase family protein [bacterium]